MRILKRALSMILVVSCLLSSLSSVAFGASPSPNDKLPPLTQDLLYQQPIKGYAERTNMGPKNWLCYDNGYLMIVNNCYFGIPADAGYFIPSSTTPGDYVLYGGQHKKDMYLFSWTGSKWKLEREYKDYKYAISCQKYLQYSLPAGGFKTYTINVHAKDSSTKKCIDHTKYCNFYTFRINGRAPSDKSPEIPGYTLNKTQNIPGYDPTKKIINLNFNKDGQVYDLLYTKN